MCLVYLVSHRCSSDVLCWVRDWVTERGVREAHVCGEAMNLIHLKLKPLLPQQLFQQTSVVTRHTFKFPFNFSNEDGFAYSDI